MQKAPNDESPPSGELTPLPAEEPKPDIAGIRPSNTRLMALLAGLAVLMVGKFIYDQKRDGASATNAPLIALEAMGQLVSLKVNYADVIEFTEKHLQGIPWTNWELPLGGTTVLLVARGDCSVASNLKEARYETVQEQERKVVIRLPNPAPLVVRINHEAKESGGSYFFAINGYGLEPLLPNAGHRTLAINNALAYAQKEVERACHHPDVLAQSRSNAEAVLGSMFQAIGWQAAFHWY